MDRFDYSLNLYHPEKDKMPGAYEWWYFDGDLHNGYNFTIVFSATNIAGPRYAQTLGKIAANHSIPYNALDLATMKVSLMDENGKPLFQGELDLVANQIRIAPDRLDVYFGDKCHLTGRERDGMLDCIINVEIPDGKGNVVKADVEFNPMVQGVKIGRGANMDTTINGKNLYHKWIVAVPTGQVKANFKITDSAGNETVVSESGFGYHDHNWGNHPLTSTLEKWYWGRIAAEDMTLIYAKVFNLVPSYPTYKPCIFTYGNNIIASTEEIDFIEDKVITGVQELNYAVEGRIRFLDGSGVKGEIKISNLQLINEQICYLRFTGKYSMDVETAHGRIKRDGGTVFEYMDLAAAVRLRAKMASQQK